MRPETSGRDSLLAMTSGLCGRSGRLTHPRVGRSRSEFRTGKRWAPFAKGGAYSPFWADIHLVVDWENDGERIKDEVNRKYPYLKGKVNWVVKNQSYYFRPGLTWPARTASGFGIRVLPAGTIFGHQGPAVMPAEDPCAALGWLTSRLSQTCIDAMVAAGDEVTSGGAARSYEVGLVQNLPWVTSIASDPEVSALCSRVVHIRRRVDLGDELCRQFLAPAVLPDLLAGSGLEESVVRSAAANGDRHLRILDLTNQLERRIHELAGLNTVIEDYLDTEVGPHPAAFDTGSLDALELRRLLQDPIDNVIDELIERRGGSRAIANLTYFADRRLEVIAHGLKRPPSQIEEFRRGAESCRLARSRTRLRT